MCVCVLSVCNMKFLLRVGINSKPCCGSEAMSWRSVIHCLVYDDEFRHDFSLGHPGKEY